MLIVDLKHDIRDFLEFPGKSLVSAEDLLRAAQDKFDELEAEIADNDRSWEDYECDECGNLEKENRDLDDEVEKLKAKIADLEAKIKTLGGSI